MTQSDRSCSPTTHVTSVTQRAHHDRIETTRATAVPAGLRQLCSHLNIGALRCSALRRLQSGTAERDEPMEQATRLMGRGLHPLSSVSWALHAQPAELLCR